MPSRSMRWRASSVAVWVSAMKRAFSSVRLGLVISVGYHERFSQKI
jgi:hypothetical protein